MSSVYRVYMDEQHLDAFLYFGPMLQGYLLFQSWLFTPFILNGQVILFIEQ